MTKRTPDTRHHLTGDWTIAGVGRQLDSLSHSLQKLPSGQNKRLHVDCARINSIDMSGLQLLHVWMECARIRGVEAELVNVPDGMQQSIHRLGLHHVFTGNHADAV